MPGPSVESVSPANNSIGNVLGIYIDVVFDREVDETSLAGNFIVEGPDTDRVTGPDMILWDRQDTEATENILDSPAFQGIVQGTFSLELLDEDNVSVSTLDTVGGSGGETLYKHRVRFTPNTILSPITKYTVYVSGDEDSTDGINHGICTRTVFSPSKGLNSGNGDIVVSGGYTGTRDDIFRFRITKTGSYGVAEYEWYKDSDELTVRTGIVSRHSKILTAGDGVSIYFTGEETTPFIINDTFSVVVRPPIYMTSTYSWSFTTGSGNIISPPNTSSYSPVGLGTDLSTSLQVISVSPDIRNTNTDLHTKVIKICFNKNINAETVTDRSVKIESFSVNGDESIPYLGEISKILTVKDNCIYAVLQSGKGNN